MKSKEQSRTVQAKGIIAMALALVEDVVYIGLGVLLAASALWLLASAGLSFWSALWTRTLNGQLIGLLDEVLLVLLIIELLYTVQVSFREHSLVAEPFLVVALIATVRKLLVLTAGIPQLPEGNEMAFRHQVIELSVLAAMVVVLVGSLVLLQRYGKSPGMGPAHEENTLRANLETTQVNPKTP